MQLDGISESAAIDFLFEKYSVFFMQDKIQTFWDITRRELDSCRAELRNKDRDMEDLQDRHQVELKVGRLR